MALIPLDDWNSLRRYQLYPGGVLPTPRDNGLSCPLCSAPLLDAAPGLVLRADPPQVTVQCSSCVFVGTRVH